MTTFKALETDVKGAKATLEAHHLRIKACEDFDEEQRKFWQSLRNHVTKWGGIILTAVITSGLVGGKLGAFLSALWGHLTQGPGQ